MFFNFVHSIYPWRSSCVMFGARIWCVSTRMWFAHSLRSWKSLKNSCTTKRCHLSHILTTYIHIPCFVSIAGQSGSRMSDFGLGRSWVASQAFTADISASNMHSRWYMYSPQGSGTIYQSAAHDENNVHVLYRHNLVSIDTDDGIAYGQLPTQPSWPQWHDVHNLYTAVRVNSKVYACPFRKSRGLGHLKWS